tara:strand:+ start:152 stop:427 length:276 start_codon:yes stop_codon:yes gene_type:complete
MKGFSIIFKGEENIESELLKLSKKVNEYTKGLRVKTYIPNENLKNIKSRHQTFSFVLCENDGYNYALHKYFFEEEEFKEQVEMIELSIDVL